MNTHALSITVVLAALTMPLASAADRDLFAPFAGATAPRAQIETHVARSRSVAVDIAALAAPVERVRVELFDDRIATLVVTRRAENGSDRFTWSGSVEGDPLGSAAFAVVDGAVSGSIRLGRELYRVHGQSDGSAIVEEVDEQRMPPCSTTSTQRIEITPTSKRAGGVSGSGGTSALVGGASTVDVMVVWTPAARIGQGGTAAIEALVDLAVLETNTAYEASGVVQRLHLVHRAELVGFVDSGNFGMDLGKVQNPSDGVADEIHGWRAACGADCVVLIVDAGGSCGVAYLMGTLDPGFAPFAFGAVARNCATGYYTFGHELGHVMGLAHDRDNSTDKTTRMSTNNQLQPANNASYSPAISAYDRYVAFVSDASNLVTGDTNALADVFVRDRTNRTTSRVNVSSTGVQANGLPQSAPSVSAFGTWIAFDSTATNLVTVDTNGQCDVFVRDTAAATTARVSIATGGAESNGTSTFPAISDNGRWVAFTSTASNLVAGASGTQVYLHDRNTSTTTLVSVSTSGGGGAGASSRPSVSSDGRYVAFTSTAANLVALDANGRADIFVRDTIAGTTAIASVSSSGAAANGDSPLSPTISSSGTFVVFTSAATNLTSGDLNGTWDVFVRDVVAGTTMRASLGLGGADGNGPSGWMARPSIESTGRYAAFLSRASNLVLGDTNGVDDVFVRDLQSGTTYRASVTPSGLQSFASSGYVDSSTAVALSAVTGDSVAFVSSAQFENLDTNAFQDVYVHMLDEPNPPGVDTYSYGYRTPDQAWRTIMAYAPGTRVQRYSNPSITWAGQTLGIADPSPFSAEAWRTLNNTGPTVAGWLSTIYERFCFGDGSATACPCGNSSAMGANAGCANSLGLAGKLEALGVASLAGDSVHLHGSGMPDSSALYFQGTAPQAGGAGAVFGDGLRCAGGSIQRLRTKINANNASTCPEVSDPSLSTLGAIAAPGTLHYQTWYRNSATFCTPSGFNLTNGVSIAWQL